MPYFLSRRRLAKEGIGVFGPGQYLPDSTVGIPRPEDLPPAKIVLRSRNHKNRPCPHCGRSCFRHGVATRILHDVGDLVSGRPRDIHSELGGGRGEKKRPGKCGRPISTGAWLTFLDTSRPTNCTTVRFASCPLSTTARSSDCFSRFSIMIPITRTLRRSSTASGWPCNCAA